MPLHSPMLGAYFLSKIQLWPQFWQRHTFCMTVICTGQSRWPCLSTSSGRAGELLCRTLLGAFLYVPFIPAILANTNAFFFLFQFFSFGRKNFNNQRGQCKKEPFEWQPPPANKQPPENPVMLVCQLCFLNNLDIYVVATAFRTYHDFFSLLFYHVSNLDTFIFFS